MIEPNNICLLTDSYKLSHWLQYPPGTERIYSYFESRGGEFDELLFFGLQAQLFQRLAGTRVSISAATTACSMRRAGDTSSTCITAGCRW